MTSTTLTPISPGAAPPTPFHVVTVVWGRAYIELFLDVAVPNQLTPGNLGALPPGSRYRVFTTAEDLELLEASAALKQANDVIPVDLVVAPELSRVSDDQFVRLTAGHSQALRNAADSGAAVIFLAPDHFMSEGTLAAAVRRQSGGTRAVVCAGLRVQRETFLAALHARGGVPALPPRELVALALGHWHVSTRSHMVDSESRPRRPVGVYWNVPGEGILSRCFYLHPLMVDPLRRDVLPVETIDHHYVAHACPDRDQVHVVSDSDEFVLFEISPVDAGPTVTAPGRVTPWPTARYLCRCDSHQQSYWRTPIRLHAGDIGPAWHSVEEESARFAKRTIRLRAAALWAYRTSRRVRPFRRRVGAFGKQLRRAARTLSAKRMTRAVVRAARPIRTLQDRATRTGRHALRRARRTVVVLVHSAVRPVHKLRKRAAQAGRRLLRRANLAH